MIDKTEETKMSTAANEWKPIKHSFFPKNESFKYDFHGENKAVFGDLAIPVKDVVANISRTAFTTVIINHRSKAYFIGRTTQPAAYVFSYGRFFAIGETTGISTHVRDSFNENNRGYWSIEFLKTETNTAELIGSRLLDYRRLGGYINNAPEKPVRLLIRSTHQKTGWAYHYVVSEKGYNAAAALRSYTAMSLVNSLEARIASTRSLRDSAGNQHSAYLSEYRVLLGSVVTDYRQNTGFTNTIVTRVEGVEEGNELSRVAALLNKYHDLKWHTHEVVQALVNHHGVKSTDRILNALWNVKVPDVCIIKFPEVELGSIVKTLAATSAGAAKIYVTKEQEQPKENQEHTLYLGRMEIPLTGNKASVKSPSRFTSVEELRDWYENKSVCANTFHKFQEEDVVAEVVDIPLPEPESATGEFLSVLRDRSTNASTIISLLAAECDLGATAFSKVIAEVISSSMVLSCAVGDITAAEIESTILIGSVPEIKRSLIYIEVLLAAAKAAHREITKGKQL